MKYWPQLLILNLSIWTHPIFALGTPKNGMYEAPNGYVTVSDAKSKSIQFQTQNTSIAGNVCDVDGQAKLDSKNTYVYKDEENCKIKLTFLEPDKVHVESDDSCQVYCGAGAYLGGHYRIRPKECRTEEVKNSRKQFQANYDGKKYSDAITVLTEKIKACKGFLSPEDLAEMRSDLSIAALHSGNKKLCLKQIQEARSENPALDKELANGLPDSPTYDKIKKINKALIFNEKKCLEK